MLSSFYRPFYDTDYIFPHPIRLSRNYTFFLLKRKDYTIPEHQVSKLRIELKDAISGYNTDKRSYKYDIDIFPDEQYIRFVFEGTYIEPVKEMTIEQIEKELGYKIKVVSDK